MRTTKGRLMGTFAEDCAGSYKFTREAQDEFAIASTTRAKQANSDGSFAWEIAPVTVSGARAMWCRQGRAALQGATRQDPDAEAGLPQGRHGYAGQLLVDLRRRRGAGHDARLDRAEKLGVKPVATIVGHSTFAQEPACSPPPRSAPCRSCWRRTAGRTDSVDLWEINEAFAVVTMAAMHDLKLPHDKVNVHGGACALGHPIGASGARIIVTLIGALKKHGKKRGVASLCIGGGEATALAVEMF
jgi:acetyl-CoA C-acetyltransferase